MSRDFGAVGDGVDRRHRRDPGGASTTPTAPRPRRTAGSATSAARCTPTGRCISRSGYYKVTSPAGPWTITGCAATTTRRCLAGSGSRSPRPPGWPTTTRSTSAASPARRSRTSRMRSQDVDATHLTLQMQHVSTRPGPAAAPFTVPALKTRASGCGWPLGAASVDCTIDPLRHRERACASAPTGGPSRGSRTSRFAAATRHCVRPATAMATPTSTSACSRTSSATAASAAAASDLRLRPGDRHGPVHGLGDHDPELLHRRLRRGGLSTSATTTHCSKTIYGGNVATCNTRHLELQRVGLRDPGHGLPEPGRVDQIADIVITNTTGAEGFSIVGVATESLNFIQASPDAGRLDHRLRAGLQTSPGRRVFLLRRWLRDHERVLVSPTATSPEIRTSSWTTANSGSRTT